MYMPVANVKFNDLFRRRLTEINVEWRAQWEEIEESTLTCIIDLYTNVEMSVNPSVMTRASGTTCYTI